jgi:hypothetical protein
MQGRPPTLESSYLKVIKKIRDLHQKMKWDMWLSEDADTYEHIYHIITESMLHAEKTATKYTNFFEWSTP